MNSKPSNVISSIVQQLNTLNESINETPDINIVILIIEAIKGGLKLPIVPKNITKVKAVFAALVEQGNNEAVEQMHPTLKRDKEFVKSLLKININVFKYVDEIITDDETIAKYVIDRVPESLRYVSYRLKEDKAFCKYVIARNLGALQYIRNRELLTDREFFMQHVSFIQYAHHELRSDLEFMKQIFQKHPDAFQFASEEIRANKEVLDMVLKIQPTLIVFADPKLWNDYAHLF